MEKKEEEKVDYSPEVDAIERREGGRGMDNYHTIIGTLCTQQRSSSRLVSDANDQHIKVNKVLERERKECACLGICKGYMGKD